MSVWLFGWLIGRQTTESASVGLVLWGKPVSVKRIATEMECPQRNIERWMAQLRKERYITTTRCRDGLVIRILNAKKFAHIHKAGPPDVAANAKAGGLAPAKARGKTPPNVAERSAKCGAFPKANHQENEPIAGEESQEKGIQETKEETTEVYFPPGRFAFEGTHLKVSKRQDRLFSEAFPWANQQQEYRRMDAWLEANPNRRPRNQNRFIYNWLAKARIPGEGGKRGTAKATNRGETSRFDEVGRKATATVD